MSEKPGWVEMTAQGHGVPHVLGLRFAVCFSIETSGLRLCQTEHECPGQPIQLGCGRRLSKLILTWGFWAAP